MPETWTVNINVDSPSEASCEGALLGVSRPYRIILSSSKNRGLGESDVKSNYVHGEPGISGDKVLWKRPFGDKM